MSRDDGFPIADVDTGLLSDPKVLRLVRRIREQGAEERDACTALLLYLSLVLASWDAGQRLALEDGLPAWWIGGHGGIQSQLVASALLDPDGRIPEAAWEGWYGPARDRRQSRREAGRVSGLISHGMTKDQAAAEVRRRSNGRSPKVSSRSPRGELDPSVPTGPTDQRARARESGAPRAVSDILRDMELDT